MKHFTLTLLFFAVLSRMVVNAQCSTGAATPGSIFFNTTVAGAASGWTQPQNAMTSDGVYSTVTLTVGILATATTNYLTATGFGFAIPAAATICGVTVTVQHKRIDLALGAIVDNSVKLVSGGSIGGTEHANSTDWPMTETTVTYGGAADTWGLSLTPSIVNNANFGVGVSATLTGGPLIALLLEAGIDYISMAITYTNTPLAITLQGFSAARQNNTNVLNWTATSNDQGDRFVVQRSGDSKNWQDLATIPAQPDNMQYSYIDDNPLSGNNYYRLYLLNQDAQGSYSAIQEISQETIGISCYPNPVVSTINVSSPAPIHNVVLRDLQGRTIQSKSPGAPSNTLQMPAGNLPPGIYLLQVDGALFKVLKQ
jgi:hypothetical protein